VGECQQVIVFRETVGETLRVAEYLAAALSLPGAKNVVERLPSADQSLASKTLLEVVSRGVGFHNSHLSADERRVIEEEFRAVDSGLRVLVATTTLAMGVNTPATSVIIVGLTQPGDDPYSVAEYKNLAGRAGRLGMSEHGASFLVSMDARQADHNWRHYVRGKPETLTSRFLEKGTDPRSLVVRVLAAGKRATPNGLTREEIAIFLESSFGAYQQSKARAGWVWSRENLLHVVDDLSRHGLIDAHGGERYKLTELGRLAGEMGIEVASVIGLVDSLRGLNPDMITDPALITAVQSTAELDAVAVPLNKKTPKEAQTWLGALRDQGVTESLLRSLSRNTKEAHDLGARAKRAVAALDYISGKDIGSIEQMLQKHGRGFNGSAGPIRSVASRTCDVIGAAARVAEISNRGLELGSRIERLRIRLTLGIPGGVVDLGREAGQELSRGDYLLLLKAGLVTADRIDAANDTEILACVGKSKARAELVRGCAAKMRERAQLSETSKPSLAPYSP
jgi:replicative superfamily II helicase